MADYPTSLDSLTNPGPSDTLDSPSHSDQHSDANDILEALEAKVGIGASTPTAGKILTGTGAGESSWEDAPTGTIPSGTDPGDLLAWDGDSWEVLPIGDDDDVLTADSGEALGVKWAEGGGGGSIPSARAWLVDDYEARDYPVSPNATYDDEFNDASGMSGPVNGLNARWNWRNQGSATATFSKDGWMTLTCPASSSFNCRVLEITAFADGTYEAHIALDMAGIGSVSTMGGIILIDGTNGDPYLVSMGAMNGVGNGVSVLGYTNLTGSGAAIVGSLINIPHTGGYLRVVKSGTALQAWFSFDGIGWRRWITWTDAKGVDRIGLFVNETDNTGITKLHVDYFRKVA